MNELGLGGQRVVWGDFLVDVADYLVVVLVVGSVMYDGARRAEMGLYTDEEIVMEGIVNVCWSNG